MAAKNPVGWFEIPVNDMDRAIAFYEKVLGLKLAKQDMEGLEMAWFPMDNGEEYGATGSLVRMDEMYEPNAKGTLVYFSSQGDDLADELGRVEGAGGSIEVPKKSIGPHGFVAWCRDTEGNRFALHSMK